MNAKSAALRPIPLGLSLATFLAISYLACLTLALIIPDRGLHGPWLQFLAGFSWTWQGIMIGLVESLACGLFVGFVFAPIYNFFNAR
jgi:hypothetical protein